VEPEVGAFGKEERRRRRDFIEAVGWRHPQEGYGHPEEGGSPPSLISNKLFLEIVAGVPFETRQAEALSLKSGSDPFKACSGNSRLKTGYGERRAA